MSSTPNGSGTLERPEFRRRARNLMSEQSPNYKPRWDPQKTRFLPASSSVRKPPDPKALEVIRIMERKAILEYRRQAAS
jgi:hypothetical protein